MRKTSRRLLALLLCLLLMLPLLGCSQKAVEQVAQILLNELIAQQAEQAEATARPTQRPQQTPRPANTPKADLWTAPPEQSAAPEEDTQSGKVRKGQSYTQPQDVADYIHLYGALPPNFITKNEARALGWESSEGNLWDVAPGKSIGGDYFSNREKSLPTAKGRKWYECDVNYEGGYRDAERILFSSDGLIYYTDDHYNTFTQLY